ncbi:MAG: DUF2461 domain-containing protein [Polyangiales bacterium]
MAKAVTGFRGFADDDCKFFRALAKHQDRDWFNEHRAEYEEGWAEPMKALLGEVAAKIDGAYPDVELAPAKVFRLHRDVRFAKDKSPYKTHASGLLAIQRTGAVTEVPCALYLQVGVEAVTKEGSKTPKIELSRFAGSGQYSMGSEALARYRAALLDDKRGREVDKLVGKLEKEGFEIGAMEVLKKPPRGVAPDHPRARQLMHKGLMFSYPELPKGALTDPGLVGWIAAHAKKAAPLVRWLTFATA